MSLDANLIAYGIYQGSKPPTGPALIKSGFRNLVLCAREYAPPAIRFEGVRVCYACIDDDMITEKEAKVSYDAALFVVDKVRKNLPVLVTCYQGRNRSGLVTGLSLYILTGMNGKGIVDLIQSRRAGALTNPSFRAYLRSLPEAR